MTQNSPDPQPLLWDVPRTAAELGVSEQHVYRLVRNKGIPFVRINRLVRFRPEQIASWLDTRGVPAASK